MLIEASPLTASAAAAIVVLGFALAALMDAWRGAFGASTLVFAAASSSIGWVVFAAASAPWRHELEPLIQLPLTALAGVAAVLTTIPLRGLDLPGAPMALFAALWSGLVFVPVSLALFAERGVLGRGLGTVDLGGALPTLVAAGAAGAAVLLVERRHPGILDVPAARWPVILGLFVPVWLLWITWLAGMELAIDAVTPRIVVNAVIAPVAAAVAWLIVQRIHHARTTSSGVVGGLICGLAAIGPGCGIVTPLGAAVTGLLAGAICSQTGYALARSSGRGAWLFVTVFAVAPTIGAAMIGLFSARTGLVFTGQPEVFLGQLASAILVMAYSAGVSALLWMPVRALHRRRGTAVSTPDRR